MRCHTLAVRDEEVAWLRRLVNLAAAAMSQSSKIDVIRRLLQRTAEPLIIFSEYRDTVAFLQRYVRRVHQSGLVSEDWRGTRPEIGTALRSTGLDVFLDDFRQSAARLRRGLPGLGDRAAAQPG